MAESKEKKLSFEMVGNAQAMLAFQLETEASVQEKIAEVVNMEALEAAKERRAAGANPAAGAVESQDALAARLTKRSAGSSWPNESPRFTSKLIDRSRSLTRPPGRAPRRSPRHTWAGPLSTGRSDRESPIPPSLTDCYRRCLTPFVRHFVRPD